MSLILGIDDLHLSYGGIQALRGIHLEVRAGEIVCLIGANGAGKTSCLRAISGLHPVHRGSISFLGRDCTHREAAERVRLGLALCPEGRMILAQQSVEDNLKLGAWTRHGSRAIEQTLQEMFELFPRLLERRHQLAGTLSGGEQQMLAMARALMAKPRLLMLDEPSLGLAPLIVQDIFTKLAWLNKEGMAILLVEQNAHLALEISHRAYVLENGLVTLSGSAQELSGDPRVQEAYLGRT